MEAKTKLTTEQRKELFLKKYEHYGAVWPACKAVGLKRRATPYDWAKADPEFAVAFEEIKKRIEDNLASKMHMTALGRGRKLMDADQIRAGIFMLKALNPGKYAEKHQISGAGGGPVEVDVDAKGKLSSLLDRLAARVAAAQGDSGPQPERSGGTPL